MMNPALNHLKWDLDLILLGSGSDLLPTNGPLLRTFIDDLILLYRTLIGNRTSAEDEIFFPILCIF